MRRNEAPLPRYGKFPFQLTLRGIDGVEVSIEARKVNDAARYRRRRRDPALRFEFPFLSSRSAIERVQKMTAAAKRKRCRL